MLLVGASESRYRISRLDARTTGLGMSSQVVIERGDAATARRLFEEICQLYAQVFSKPPFAWDEEEPQRHRSSLQRLIEEEPSFGITIAMVGDELVGFAYGYTVPPGTRRWQRFATPVPVDLATEWEGRTFALIDFAVRREWRRHGIGRKLLDALLDSRNEERATLTVEPEATETQAFYLHLGWQHVGRKRTASENIMPFFDVYVLPLSHQAKP